ncbi:MAG: hypothetical protein JST_000588 [Candidatus Parcubacteria bacterium]|jgi:flagellar basal body-associated protein FliL|nr:MAG: hypothetical protein JST_5480 [Candidatus Parcubacteria bacterium]
MSITKTKIKKVIIVSLAVFILIATALAWLWLEKGGDAPLPVEESRQTRLMEEEEKMRYQINPDLEVEVVNESEGNFIYKIKE